MNNIDNGKIRELTVPALMVSQGNDRILFSFAVDGRLLSDFTTISRIRLSEAQDITGYQRPEVLAHIADIKAYLESEKAMLPTSIVVALDDSVTFQPIDPDTLACASATSGVLRIPLTDCQGNERKVGWIVDGQQRAAALREAKISRFPIFVTGFIASSDKEQREQFILVNSPKPLPRDLIYELLPGTESKLPALLQRRRFSATLLGRLNRDECSPLKKLIRTHTNPQGVIKDNSILRMIENSLSDGILFEFRDLETNQGDVEGMLRILKAFWRATAEVFDDAWALPPRQSRLMHGAGIIGVGLLMDAISEACQLDGEPTYETFRKELAPLRGQCHWTGGSWDFGDGSQRRWDEVQNTSKDIQLLAMHLLDLYHQVTQQSKHTELSPQMFQ